MDRADICAQLSTLMRSAGLQGLARRRERDRYRRRRRQPRLRHERVFITHATNSRRSSIVSASWAITQLCGRLWHSSLKSDLGAMADLRATPGKEPRAYVEDGEIRVISHDGAEEVISTLVFSGRLSPQHMRHFCGALLHRRMIDVPLLEHEMADVLDQTRIPIGIVPNVPLLKMMRSEHAELLTKQGSLRLGSIDYYRRHENSEVQDRTEGYCVLVAFDGQMTHIREVRGGLNDRLLCCYAGTPDGEVIRRFGYEAAVEITDVEAFAQSIGKEIGTSDSYFSSCIYVRDRALYGEVSKPINPQEMMDGQFAGMLGKARAFLKHNRYRHQTEFRIIWRGKGHVQDYLDITCPALTQFCRRVPIP
jgi:hypothetical protein